MTPSENNHSAAAAACGALHEQGGFGAVGRKFSILLIAEPVPLPV